MSSNEQSSQNGDASVCTKKPLSEKTYTTRQYGVWEVLMMDEGQREQYRRFIRDVPKFTPSLYRLAQDAHCLSPKLSAIFVLCRIWMGCQDAVTLHFSGKLLRAIEHCLKEGAPDYPEVTYFVALRLAVTAISSMIMWYSDRVQEKLQRRIKAHFQIRIMSAKLQHDLGQANNPAAESTVTASQACRALEELFMYSSVVMTVVTQLGLILHLARTDSGGPLFAILCFMQPVFSTMITKSLWSKVCIVKKTNKDRKRMDALTKLTKSEYRQDVISNDLQRFILNEYKAANERLGDVSDEEVWQVYHKHDTPFPTLLVQLFGNLPMVYCAALALWNPRQISFASIAILQQTSGQLSAHVNVALRGAERFRNGMKQIQDLYESTKNQDKVEIVEGTNPEKHVEVEDATVRGGEGIDFELRNVSFTYPGSQVSKEALNDINLKIKSGQFVVLVGANGSGKSTLLKLLCRLYQPTIPSPTSNDDDDEKKKPKPPAGQVLIDSLPAPSYTESSLRRSMAVLSQDNLIYPGFSLGENIGLGHTPLLSDEETLRIAATKAGALEVVERMKNSMNTILDPLADYYQFNVRTQDKDHPLKKVLEELRRPTEVSGGEKQRIVAARTFMRFNSGHIRFLAVDEPSSALDAEGEEYLLENLLKERQGKTIIFVTHRFGKLTKRADLILCMKEGKIVELGTHKELIKIIDGEYKKLYDIQASPFRDEEEFIPVGPAKVVAA